MLSHLLYRAFFILVFARFLSVAPGVFAQRVGLPTEKVRQVQHGAEERFLYLGGMEAIQAGSMPKSDSDGQEHAAPTDPPVLAPKLQKELGKALEALQANKPSQARSHLDAVFSLAPDDANVNFLLGMYSAETNDWVVAQRYWEKVLAVHPNHLGALLALGYALVRVDKPAEAAKYLTLAVEGEPTCWRVHALLAAARLREGLLDESIRQAERALELGHGPAEIVQPLLAQALQLHGDKGRAIQVLQTYLNNHAGDAVANEQLENLQTARTDKPTNDTSPAAASTAPRTEVPLANSSLLLPSNWLPPDVDEKVPPVEPGVPCDLNEVIQKSGKRMQEFVANVDRFTATEAVMHESIDKWGLASRTVRLEFNYVVSVEEVRHGILSIQEYRGPGDYLTKFPDGIASVGLPALVLILHPYYAGNFDMTCEGLARWRGAPAWQVYFRQRTDRPNTMRVYKLGVLGPEYPVALKGRAWIQADSHQIVRLETDLVAPLAEIRLAADHVIIDYGPVHFQTQNLEMWLPQSAEVYYDWRGRRSHRRHSFNNYLLFSVDDKQQISTPKSEGSTPADSPGTGTKPSA